MAAWIFESAGRRPSFLIGGIAENFGSASPSQMQRVYYRGDEYDTAFFDKDQSFSTTFRTLPFSPPSSSITRYLSRPRSREVCVQASREPGSASRPRHCLGRQPHRHRCVERAFCPVERYGFHSESFWRIENVQYLPPAPLDVRRDVSTSQTLSSHSPVNTTCSTPRLLRHGTCLRNFCARHSKALRDFFPSSAVSRFEPKSAASRSLTTSRIIHAIAATLTALRKRYAGRPMAVLEPRSNTLRRNVFQRELVESLALADQIAIASVFFKTRRVKAEERLDVNAWCRNSTRVNWATQFAM